MQARQCIFFSTFFLSSPSDCFCWAAISDIIVVRDFRRFEKYPEDNASDLYGRPGPDPYGKDFPDFDYTSI
jgi:hypothetical protein